MRSFERMPVAIQTVYAELAHPSFSEILRAAIRSGRGSFSRIQPWEKIK